MLFEQVRERISPEEIAFTPEGPTKADVTRLRHRAADLIEYRGHCQNAYWDLDGRTCLMNALYEAETGNDLQDQHFRRSPLLKATIVSLGLDGYPGVCSYNNTRNAKQIVAHLRRNHHAA